MQNLVLTCYIINIFNYENLLFKFVVLGQTVVQNSKNQNENLMKKTEIYKSDNLLDGDAKGLVTTVEGMQRNIFLVRKGGKIFAFLNWCPHNQVLIDQIPNKFFNAEKTYIQCSKHGALFQIEDGLCVEGPCEGEYLKSLNIEVENGIIFLVE